MWILRNDGQLARLVELAIVRYNLDRLLQINLLHVFHQSKWLHVWALIIAINNDTRDYFKTHKAIRELIPETTDMQVCGDKRQG